MLYPQNGDPKVLKSLYPVHAFYKLFIVPWTYVEYVKLGCKFKLDL